MVIVRLSVSHTFRADFHTDMRADIIFKIGINPLLNIHAAVSVAISKIFFSDENMLLQYTLNIILSKYVKKNNYFSLPLSFSNRYKTIEIETKVKEPIRTYKGNVTTIER